MKTRNLTLCGLFAALMALCAWISIPLGTATFTLQTFGVILALLVLGGKWGTVTVLVYLLLGAVGVPVFSGFQGGFSVLFGPTGGFLWGFLVMALVFWLLTALFDEKLRIFTAVFGLLLCYGCGAGWMAFSTGGQGSFRELFLMFVLPYILPDILKFLLAVFLSRRLRPFLPA